MGSMVWGSEIAEVYDATYAALAVPSVVDPMVDLLAQLVGDGAALEFAVGTGRIALPLSAAASASMESSSRPRWCSSSDGSMMLEQSP